MSLLDRGARRAAARLVGVLAGGPALAGYPAPRRRRRAPVLILADPLRCPVWCPCGANLTPVAAAEPTTDPSLPTTPGATT